jgi:ketosteroid isomerase-like protein
MAEEYTTPGLVEVVTALFEAADRGDWDWAIGHYAPDAVWESDDGILDRAGASSVRGMWEEFEGMFEDFTIKVETVVGLGNGIVYSVYYTEGRPAGSTGVVAERLALIFEWVNGKIVRLIARRDATEGREVAERLAEERG